MRRAAVARAVPVYATMQRPELNRCTIHVTFLHDKGIYAMQRPRSLAIAIFSICLFALAQFAPQWHGVRPAQAATLIVTSSVDGPGGVCPDLSFCNLRAAIAAAAPGDTIRF